VSGRFLRALRFSGTYDPGVVPLLLTVAGVLALAAAAVIQRGFGPRARVGRLLAVAPRVSIADAIRLAESGEPSYVRVDGRLDSDQEFEDDAHRPLVVRRTTLQTRPATSEGSWREVEVNLETVPFAVREGLDEIAVDGAALAHGLVVVPREHRGIARDLGERAPAGVPPDAPVRMVVELVSTVEHGTLIGVPRRGAGGAVSIGPGLGRPLILTTLERDEAMRVLTGGAAGRARFAVAAMTAGAVLLGLALLWVLVDFLLGGAATALAASPEPSLRPGSDTRTTGGGPGLVGAPLLALLAVLGIALLSVAVSLAYVRLTGGPRREDKEEPPKPW
jgi:hypothetical protein